MTHYAVAFRFYLARKFHYCKQFNFWLEIYSQRLISTSFCITPLAALAVISFYFHLPSSFLMSLIVCMYLHIGMPNMSKVFSTFNLAFVRTMLEWNHHCQKSWYFRSLARSHIRNVDGREGPRR